jgi:hypothetical protein
MISINESSGMAAASHLVELRPGSSFPAELQPNRPCQKLSFPHTSVNVYESKK